jgi:hypothetical protein
MPQWNDFSSYSFGVNFFHDGQSLYLSSRYFNSVGIELPLFVYNIKHNLWNTAKLKTDIAIASNFGFSIHITEPYLKNNELLFANVDRFTDALSVIKFNPNNNTFTNPKLLFNNFEKVLPWRQTLISEYSGGYGNNLNGEGFYTTFNFQNKIVQYLYNQKSNDYLRDVNYLKNNEYYVLKKYTPSVFSAVESGFQNFERQRLLVFDLDNNTCTEIQSLPEILRKTLTDNVISDMQLMFIPNDKNIYVCSPVNTKCKTIWKYIP